MMSSRVVKSYNLSEGVCTAEDEPEEGEIADDYDLIVSSDEEFSMRQRIRELEAENEEIEQIAVISRCYVDKISTLRNHLEFDRSAKIPTDASSISSTELVIPKKRKRHKSKERKKKHHHVYQYQQPQHQYHHQHHHQQLQQHKLQQRYQYQYQYEQHSHPRRDQKQISPKIRLKKVHCKKRQKLLTKKYHKNHSERYIYKERGAESVSLESPESSESSVSFSLTDINNYTKSSISHNRRDHFYDCGTYIPRDTLRLAVARNSTESRFSLKKSCLKDKLLKQGLVGQTVNDTNQVSRNESHDARAEIDDDADDVQVIVNEQDIQTVDEDSTDSMEEKELRLIALKSANLKKYKARKIRNDEAPYSPTDFDMLSSDIMQQDNKFNDIDVVDLEAEDSENACVILSPDTSPQLIMLDDQEESQHTADCKPIDMDIANSDNEDTTTGSWSKEVEPSFSRFSLVSQEFANHFQYGFYNHELHELPPPPPGVDDYEHAPPPPTYHKIYNIEMQNMELDNEVLTDAHNKVERKKNTSQDDKITDWDNTSSIPQKSNNEEEEDDEEEEALRALLLSKFQSPRNHKRMKIASNVDKCNYNINEIEMREQLDDTKRKPTEFILKEAVKRLKIHSQTEFQKDDSVVDDNNHNLGSSKSIAENENKNGSTILFDKLQNQVNRNNGFKRSIDQDHFAGKENVKNLEITASNCYYKMGNVENIEEHVRSYSDSSEVAASIDVSDITKRLQKIKEDVLSSTDKKVHEVSDLKQQHTENITKIEINNLDNIASEKMNAFMETEDKNIEIGSSDILSKENMTDNISNNINLTINKDLETKTLLDSEERRKIQTKTECSNEVKIHSIAENSPSKIKSIITSSQISVAPSYSLLRTTKVVKPNKVINANFDLNRKPVLQTPDSKLPSGSSKIATNTKILNSVNNTRLITSIDQVKHMYKAVPFIISVQNSSNESSGDEWGDYDLLNKPLHDYNDNASPLSLNLESPTHTPLRSNSPIDIGGYGQKNAEVKAKIGVFLKSIRNSVSSQNSITNILQKNEPDQCGMMNKTPLAVRHLPVAAQNEYRRLVHRMKLLENKRKIANVDEKKQERNNNKKPNFTTKDVTKGDIADSTPKSSLVKKVLIRNANNKTSSTVTNELITDKSTISPQLNKTNVLRSYENLYVKIGAGIVNNLDKSLKLVEEAKKVKITKLLLENRLKELKAEIDILQMKHKEEQQKISRIYPSICSTNDVITSLKQKRSKIFKATLSLGKTIKGEEYRLNNDLKESITSKSKQLAMEIKVVNSLKAQDVTKMKDSLKRNKNKERITDNSQTKPIRGNCDKNLISNSLTSEVVVSLDGNYDKDETKGKGNVLNKSEISLTSTQLAGNTEFQDMKSSGSKKSIKAEDACRLEVYKMMSKNADANNDSEQIATLPSYTSPLEHLRNIERNMDPNGVICPYDLMGNCEDVTCKYVHITQKAITY